jgi:integral membrane protein
MTPSGSRASLLSITLPAALLRYRIMAYVVGVGLCVLVFVGIPLQIAGYDQVVAIVGPFHGFLYIAYLVFALDLARRARFSFGEMMAMVGAGLLPGLAFVAEHFITRRVQADIDTGVAERRFFLHRTAVADRTPPRRP